MICASLIALLAAATISWGAELVNVSLERDEHKETDKKKENRLGFLRLERVLKMDNLQIRYEAYVHEEDRTPYHEQYADWFLGCEFGHFHGNGGWNRWDFLGVTITSPEGDSYSAVPSQPLDDFVIVEESDRGLADMCWPTPPSGTLCVRVMKLPGDEEWAFLEVGIDGETDSALSSIAISSYPYNTSKTGDQPRQRWVTTLMSDYEMTDQPRDISTEDEWALIMHNKLSQEDGGVTLLLDPQEVSSLQVHGTYPVYARFTPAEGARYMHIGMSYFDGEHHEAAAERMREQGAGWLKRMRGLDFSAHPAAGPNRQEAEEDIQWLLQFEAIAQQFGQTMEDATKREADLAGALQKAADTGVRVDRSLERELGFARQNLTEVHRAMQRRWLELLPPLAE